MGWESWFYSWLQRYQWDLYLRSRDSQKEGISIPEVRDHTFWFLSYSGKNHVSLRELVTVQVGARSVFQSSRFWRMVEVYEIREVFQHFFGFEGRGRATGCLYRAYWFKNNWGITPLVWFSALKKGCEDALPVFLHRIAVLQTLASSHMFVKNIFQEIGSVVLCNGCQPLPGANSTERRRGKKCLTQTC